MAKLRVLKQKDKRYAFKTFDNDKAKEPAVCVFKEFPAIGEVYFKNFKLSGEITDESLPEFEFKRFAENCIGGFENLTITETGEKIETVEQFLKLPGDFTYGVLMDCCMYAMERDDFSLGE